MTLSQKAYGVLAKMILERRLPAGAAVVEQSLAGELGVSRTPLRQALQRLEGEGLMYKAENRSYVVRKVDLREYLQSLRMRELIEAEAAMLSAARVPHKEVAKARANLHIVQASIPYDMLAHWRSDDEVHELVIANCGNDVMSRMLRSLRVTTKLFEIERLSERLEPDSRQHELILDALEARDGKAARRALGAHIRSLYQFALKTIC